jgi:hypothetical protein
MKNRWIPLTSNRAAAIAIACLLIGGTLAWADEDGASCSNRTLRGDYAFTIEGFILPPGAGALPIRGVHMTTFDGQGGLTQVDHIIVNGAPVSTLEWTPVAGTYKVNPDCTGTVSLVSNGHFTNLKVVIANNGKRVFTVVTPPFDGPPRTVSSAGVRLH